MIKSAPTVQNPTSLIYTTGGYKLIIAYFSAEVKGASLFVYLMGSRGSVSGITPVSASFIETFFDFFHTFSHGHMLNG